MSYIHSIKTYILKQKQQKQLRMNKTKVHYVFETLIVLFAY